MTTSPSQASNGTAPRSGGRPRVVIVGSGFGGLFAAKALRRTDVDVTVIGKTSHHLFQPLLYQVATGILSEGEIAPPTREVLRRQQNARVVLGEVTAIDLEQKLVTSEVLEALMGLGYSAAEAQAALMKIPQDQPMTLEEQITFALRSFSRRE